MYILPETLSQDITKFSELAEQFEQGKVEPVKFKITRVPMGVYEQRKDGVYMVRIRTTGGVIYPKQLLRLIEIGQTHHSNLLHITTRQEIQIQNLELKEVEPILLELKEIGLATKGGGGNTVRNILVSIHSGISSKDVFDLTPHAMAITSKLIAEPDSFTLPRKLKLAFSTNEEDTDYAGVNDLGFIAKIKDGQRGYKVYLGGSVASNPTVGWLLSEFIPEKDLFALAEATKQFFSQYGNRKNKHKARLRYIFYRLGKEETLRLFNQFLEEARKTTPPFIPEEKEETAKSSSYTPLARSQGPAYDLWKERYVTPQVQPGQSSVLIPFIHGNIPLDQPEEVEAVRALLTFVSRFGEDTVRFSTMQNVHLRNIPNEALPDVYSYAEKLLVNVDQPVLINNIVSCTGASTCRLGIGLSKGLAAAIRRALAKSSLDLDKLAGFRIHISGCPNSCGQQAWADLGFSGKVLRNNRIYPGYQIYAGANRGKTPQLAEIIGDLNAHDIPEFVVALLGDYIGKLQAYATFRAYLDAEGKDFIRKYLAGHKEIPAFEEDKNYYFDWGAETLFSIADRGVGECSAGLFDMIDLDLKTINKDRKALETEQDPKKTNELLYEVIFAASRMLLITRGAEPKTTNETFDLFLSHFIEAGLVSASFRPVVELARDNKAFDFSTRKDEIYKLADTVIDLYQNMDDSLQFKNIPAVEQAPETVKTETAAEPIQTNASEANKFKDLRGVACPMNFVQTKILLSGMQSGEILEILLDDGQPIANVPGSVRSEGHEVLEQTSVDDYWKVVIKKK